MSQSPLIWLLWEIFNKTFAFEQNLVCSVDNLLAVIFSTHLVNPGWLKQDVDTRKTVFED